MLAAAALLLGGPVALLPAVLGVGVGLISIRVARARGRDLALSFAVLDWLLLGCTLAAAGGADSWLLGALPILAFGQLASTPRDEWPYLIAPSLLLLIILAIDDPSLGGNRVAGVAKVAILVGGGVAAAARVRRRPQRRQYAPRVDETTGLYTGERLRQFLSAGMQTALAEHEPLSIVDLRLERFTDCRAFLGAQGSEGVVKNVARRVERRLAADDRAFRVGPDRLVVLLPGRTLAEARELAADVAHDVSSGLIAGRRQTIAAGASSFPTVRDPDELLAIAREEAAPQQPLRPVPQAIPLAAAQ